MGFIFHHGIVPKFFDIRAVPRIRTLKSWDPIEGFLEKLANLLVQAGNFHDSIVLSRDVSEKYANTLTGFKCGRGL